MDKNIKITISLGEAIDRLTILDIKTKFINDPLKLNNINFELNILHKQIHKYKNIISEGYEKLYNVNLKLWQIEDKLRIFEKNKIFNEEFVNLSRSVYKYNDKRAKIKKEINIKYNSNIIEEKSYEGF